MTTRLREEDFDEAEDSEATKPKRTKRQESNEEAGDIQKEDLFEAAVCCVESVISKAATSVTAVLTAPYDTCVFADTMFNRCSEAILELNLGFRVERAVIVPVVAFERIVGVLKIPFVFYTKSGRALMLLEIKTKRTALKEVDVENCQCAAEQLQESDEDGFRPRSMIVNFSSGEHSVMTLLSDGTIRN